MVDPFVAMEKCSAQAEAVAAGFPDSSELITITFRVHFGYPIVHHERINRDRVS